LKHVFGWLKALSERLEPTKHTLKGMQFPRWVAK
jgi:hypothetical protein